PTPLLRFDSTVGLLSCIFLLQHCTWHGHEHGRWLHLHPLCYSLLSFSMVEHSVQGVLVWRSTGFSLRSFLLILITPPEVVEGHSRSCRFPVCLVSQRDLDKEVSLGHHGDGRDKKRVTLGAKASSSFSSQDLFSFHIAGFNLALAETHLEWL
ncbi:uncharacterized protein BDZ83DRAFT_764498, partial [Colletotrichum acutatum]